MEEGGRDQPASMFGSLNLISSSSLCETASLLIRYNTFQPLIHVCIDQVVNCVRLIVAWVRWKVNKNRANETFCKDKPIFCTFRRADIADSLRPPHVLEWFDECKQVNVAINNEGE
jgi:hypothetical protein